MSKEIKMVNMVTDITVFMEEYCNEFDGIDKVVLLKTVAAYYESIVAAESMRAMIFKSIGVIK